MATAAIFTAIFGAIMYIAMQQSNQNFQEYLNEKNNQFAHNEAEIAREFNSEPERFDRMTTELGFNPNLAAASIMGSSASPSPYAAQPSPVGSIPNDPAIANLFGSLSNQIYDSVKQRAEIDNLNANTRFSDIQSFYFPLQFDEIKKLNDGQLEMWKAEGKYHESFSKYYDELSNWVAPLSALECQERWGNYQRSMSEVSLNGARIKTELSEQKLNLSGASLNYQKISESKAYEALLKEETLTQEHITTMMSYSERRELASAVLAEMDVNLRRGIDQLPLPQNAKDYLVLSYAFGDDEAKKVADDMVDYEIQLGRKVYDAEVQQQYENWLKNALISTSDAPAGFAEGVGYGVGFSLPGVFKGFRAGKAGKSAKGAKGAKGDVSSNKHYRDANGNHVRVDSYGNKWINGVPQ